MVPDQARRDLYEVLEQQLGQNQAGTLMELLPPVGWADVARQSDLTALRGEMAQLRGELKGEMASCGPSSRLSCRASMWRTWRP